MLLRVSAVVLIVAAAAAVCGLIIATPLWLFATRATASYNVFVAVVAVAALGGTLAVRLARRTRQAHSGRRALVSGAQVLARTVAAIAIACAHLLAFTRWGLIAGLVGLPVTLGVLGVLLFGGRRPRSESF